MSLTCAGAELRFLNGWAIGGRFDDEFADIEPAAGHRP